MCQPYSHILLAIMGRCFNTVSDSECMFPDAIAHLANGILNAKAFEL